MTYEELLARLFALSDEGYRAFHKKLLKNDGIRVIGVRMPALRALAREWKGEFSSLLAFPDEYYEVTVLKCAVANFLPFGELCAVCDALVARLDNWATCDMFAPACIARNREAFKSFILRYLSDPRVFVRRFALTTLLHFYVREEELGFVGTCLKDADTSPYYVSMAAAWLTAEVLIRFYDRGKALLTSGILSEATFRRAVRKACESYRLSDAQKEELRALKCHILR